MRPPDIVAYEPPAEGRWVSTGIGPDIYDRWQLVLAIENPDARVGLTRTEAMGLILRLCELLKLPLWDRERN